MIVFPLLILIISHAGSSIVQNNVEELRLQSDWSRSDYKRKSSYLILSNVRENHAPTGNHVQQDELYNAQENHQSGS